MGSDGEKKKKKKKESSKKDKKAKKSSSNRKSSRSVDDEDVVFQLNDSEERNKPKKPSRKSSRTPSRSSSQVSTTQSTTKKAPADENLDEAPQAEDNVFTQNIPAPPLSNDEDDNDAKDEQEIKLNGSQRFQQDDGSDHTDPLSAKAVRQQLLTATDEKQGPPTPAELQSALETCNWQEVHEFISNKGKETIEEHFATEFGEHRESPLHSIVSKGSPKFAKYILELLSPSLMETMGMTRDGDGNTPLHLYCANVDVITKEETAVLKHLAKGAPRALQMPNGGGDTPLHLFVASKACTSGDFAAEAAAEQAVSLLLGECMEVAIIQDSSGATPLHTAISHGAHERVLMRLLDIAPVAAKISDQRGMLPLHYVAAFWKTQFAPVEQLLKAYPEALTKATMNGDTPLHLLISNCQGGEDRLDRQTSKVIEILAGMNSFDDENDSVTSPVILSNSEKVSYSIR